MGAGFARSRVRMDPARIRAHQVLIDSFNILSRGLARHGEDNSWRGGLGDERRAIGDVACHLHSILAISARWIGAQAACAASFRMRDSTSLLFWRCNGRLPESERLSTERLWILSGDLEERLVQGAAELRRRHDAQAFEYPRQSVVIVVPGEIHTGALTAKFAARTTCG